MNRHLVLSLALFAATFGGCTSRPSKPDASETKIVLPPPPPKPAAVFTRNVRHITSQIKVTPGRWKMIICHHSALASGNAAKYDKDHRRRGMENGLAYHFVIGNGVDSGDGEIEIGSRWITQIKGGHVRDDAINEVAIGICLVGNLQEKEPTANQIAALKELLVYLRDDVVGAPIAFKVHCEADPGHTECPGKYFPTEAMRSLFTPPTPAKTAVK